MNNEEKITNLQDLINQKDDIIASQNLEIQKLKNKVSQFENVLENTPSLVWIKDQEHKLIYLNPAFESAFGIKKSDWMNKSGWDLFPKEQAEIMAQNDQSVFDSQIVLKTIETISINSKAFIYLSYKFPFTSEGNNYIAGISIDISSQVETEKKLNDKLNELKQAQNVRDRLISILGHDIRSPISSMINLVQLLKEDVIQSKEELIEFINPIESSSENILKLIDNLLIWIQNEQTQILPEFQPIDFQEIIKNTISLLSPSADQKQIKITTELANDVKGIGDYNMTNVILRNLVANAIKFTNNLGEIQIQLIEKENIVDLIIKDNGIGMSKDSLDHIKERNTIKITEGTAREKGTGLGLSIVQDFIEKQSGTLSIESELGKGTSITFSLPKLKKEENLYQIVFRSESLTGLNQDDLKKMEKSFSYRNKINQISGILIYNNGVFIQLIEGNKIILEDLYNKIISDPRHTKVIILHSGYCTERISKEWGLRTISSKIPEANFAVTLFPDCQLDSNNLEIVSLLQSLYQASF